MRTKVLAVVTVLAIIAAMIYFFRQDDDAASDHAQSEVERDGRARSRRSSSSSSASSSDEGESSAERAARRARRELERRERFERMVELVSLGPAPVTLAPRAVIDALQTTEAEFEDCMEAAGGRDAYRDAMRATRRALRAQQEQEEASLTPERREALRLERIAARNGRPWDRVMRFDVRADGTVDPESIELEPQVPEPFGACFVRQLSALHLESVGADGARVEMPMRGPMRRSADAGMPTPGVPRMPGTRRELSPEIR